MDAMNTAGGNMEILLTNGGFAQDLETLKGHICLLYTSRCV